jgi:hypothetical protein
MFFTWAWEMRRQSTKRTNILGYLNVLKKLTYWVISTSVNTHTAGTISSKSSNNWHICGQYNPNAHITLKPLDIIMSTSRHNNNEILVKHSICRSKNNTSKTTLWKLCRNLRKHLLMKRLNSQNKEWCTVAQEHLHQKPSALQEWHG